MISRRRFLLGAGAVVAVSALPFRVRAQGTATVLGLSQSGIPIIPETVGGVTLTRSQVSTLNRVALQIAKNAPSRAAANGTLSAVVRSVVSYAPRAGIYGIAAAAAIGGAYYLFTGNSPLDPLMNLTFGESGMYVKYPCACGDVPLQSGSYPDSVTMGYYKQSTCTNTVYYRIAVVTNSSTTSSGRPDANWSWGHTQNLGGGQYRHFYTRSIVMEPQTCASQSLHLPGNTDWGKTLSETDKLKALSGAALDALGLSAWSWTADPALGGGGGFGGGGAGGSWVDPPQALKDQVTQAPLNDAAIVSPLPYTGTDPDPTPPTVGQMLDTWPTQGDPGPVEYPSSVKFPEDDGYVAPGDGGTEEPPTEGEGDDWTSWLPSAPNFGLPGLPDLGFPEMVDWSPSALTGPSFATSCVNPAVAFTFDVGAYGSYPINLALPACEYLMPLGTYIKPAVIAGASIVAAKKVLDL